MTRPASKQPQKPLLSITKKDLRVDTFCSGGAGGQHQNKTASGVRITHLASGAVGESRSERSQLQNKRLALRRLSQTKKFKTWVKLQSAMVLQGHRDVEDKVDKMLREENLKIEYVGEKCL